ncbi:MAG: hypothetical protein JNK73_06730 [Bacteroidia bacterium]|nr:hypothetical protein [Bacteroidia bacterium]
MKNVSFDLIVFTTILAGERWGGRERMKKVYQLLGYLKTINVTKVIHPQDEWIHTNLLNDFIIDFKISHVFSVAPPSEWKKIYNRVNFSKVNFHSVLTGYLSEETIKKCKAITDSITHQNIDIGYRAYKSPPWLGKHGFLKTKIADIFLEQAPKHNFEVNISTEEEDTILGDDWLKFMASCKYFIGVEGGSTIIDPDGEIFKKGTSYFQLNPEATFEELEKLFFEGMDGNLGLIAISPRHLEACVTKTCQVLIEGNYNNVLKPNVHYIEIKKDFSNLEAVFQQMKNENLRKKYIEAAYRDVVESKKYTYENYTATIISQSIDTVKAIHKRSLKNCLGLWRNRISDKRFRKIKQNEAFSKE